MKSIESYLYNCSKEYLNSLSPDLYHEVQGIVSNLPKRSTQSEVNQDLFWTLTSKGWSYHAIPSGINGISSPQVALDSIMQANTGDLCLTTTTLEARWRADFAKLFEGKLVQIEAQFGKVEAMFKDFCGFPIAHFERRLALGIEIVMSDPGKYFSQRRNSISGMAYFNIAKTTLPAIGLSVRYGW